MGCGGGCEIVGSVILSPGGSSPIYTKPMPRGGESALVSLNVTEFFSASVALVVAVEMRNEDGTTWTTAGTFAAITGTGVVSKNVSGVKQLVRLLIHFDSGSTHGDSARIDGINFSWRPY